MVYEKRLKISGHVKQSRNLYFCLTLTKTSPEYTEAEASAWADFILKVQREFVSDLSVHSMKNYYEFTFPASLTNKEPRLPRNIEHFQRFCTSLPKASNGKGKPLQKGKVVDESERLRIVETYFLKLIELGNEAFGEERFQLRTQGTDAMERKVEETECWLEEIFPVWEDVVVKWSDDEDLNLLRQTAELGLEKDQSSVKRQIVVKKEAMIDEEVEIKEEPVSEDEFV